MNFNFSSPATLSKMDQLNSGGMDMIGRPVFSDVKLKLQGKEIVFLDAIVTVEEDFTIIKTAMAGRSGTIKEYVSAADYRVTIIASLISDGLYKYPVQEVKNLVKIINAAGQIEVISEYLALFEIYYLVCEKAMMKQEIGKQNRQSIELTCISDKDVQLVIDEEKD